MHGHLAILVVLFLNVHDFHDFTPHSSGIRPVVNRHRLRNMRRLAFSSALNLQSLAGALFARQPSFCIGRHCTACPHVALIDPQCAKFFLIYSGFIVFFHLPLSRLLAISYARIGVNNIVLANLLIWQGVSSISYQCIFLSYIFSHSVSRSCLFKRSLTEILTKSLTQTSDRITDKKILIIGILWIVSTSFLSLHSIQISFLPR